MDDDDLSGVPAQPDPTRRDSSRVRGALGSRSTGWIVAAFLGGVAVTLAAVLIAGPQTMVVRSVSLAVPVTARPGVKAPRRVQVIGPAWVPSRVVAGAAVPCRVFGPAAVAVPGGLTIVRAGRPGRVTIYLRRGHGRVVEIPGRKGVITALPGRRATIYVRGARPRQVLINRGAVTLMPAQVHGCQVLAPVKIGAGKP